MGYSTLTQWEKRMDITERKQIAREFVNAHKQSRLAHWAPINVRGDAKLVTIYYKLRDGAYGKVRRTGLEDEHSTQYAVEIGAANSRVGRPVVFEWIEDREVKNYDS